MVTRIGSRRRATVMPGLALVNGRIATGEGCGPAAVMVIGKTITSIGELPANWTGEVIDVGGRMVTPGLIDLQTNGGFGKDFTSDPASMWGVGARLPQFGVTSFLPTIVSSLPQTLDSAQSVLRSPPTGYEGATALGLHFEGPMLSPERVGAHEASCLQLPTADLVSDWSPESGVAMVTVAPELSGARAVIETLSRRGVVVAAGHSNGSAEQIAEGVEAGVTHVTHLYNAMSPLNHREPGLVGAALANTDLTAGLIVDGVHVYREAVSAAWNAKGKKGIALVTDASAAQGMPNGIYDLGSCQVTVTGDEVRNADGTLAGTNLTLPIAIRNLISFTGCSVSDALASATSTPAAIMRLTAKGSLSAGFDADIAVFDENFEVALTVAGGQVVYDPNQMR